MLSQFVQGHLRGNVFLAVTGSLCAKNTCAHIKLLNIPDAVCYPKDCPGLLTLLRQWQLYSADTHTFVTQCRSIGWWYK